mmetsp:Transcript_14549/g.31620  ORF Transcript_14549/g.31620 Transcript_14549/m.31620 type:complete len:104 (-) Transcript_14549:70-381(-)
MSILLSPGNWRYAVCCLQFSCFSNVQIGACAVFLCLAKDVRCTINASSIKISLLCVTNNNFKSLSSNEKQDHTRLLSLDNRTLIWMMVFRPSSFFGFRKMLWL